MKRPAPQTLGGVGALVLLGLVAVVTARPSGPAGDSYASTDYGAGGYRAWAMVEAREGVATGRFVLRPIELDSSIDTLISAQPPPASVDPNLRTAADLAALAAWVRGGGRLVYAGRNGALREAETRLLHLPLLVPDVGARGALTGPFARAVTALYQSGANRMLLVEHAGQSMLADADGDIVVRYPLGRGEVLAVADAAPFTNRSLARAQNARLAYLIARPSRAGGVVAFDDGLHGALVDRPWYRALPIPVRVSLGIAGVALLLALFGGALPGIPPMRLRPAREPTSAEFVDALAALYERIGARAGASAILVRDALGAAARGAGLGDDAPLDVLTQRVGERGGDRAAVTRLAHALDAPPAGDDDLLALAKLAHALRKECTYGGNGDGRRAAFAGRARTRRRR